ncbi:MAG: metallophosphoesterase [Actinobacteria bacterium]|nr:metallophosphoesterase [Actinomycetota bacterium]
MSIDEQPSPDPATILRTLVYERVDSFFDSGSSGYSPFYNKKIYSPEELRQQDRTIWFVRPATASDPSHEIRLLDTNQVAPYDFPVRAIESESRTLLWVSDLHLSKDHHRFPLASSTSAADLASALERDLNAMEVGPLAGMIVSGDLTWRGSAEEFEFARKFIRGVQSWSKLTDYQILICPGNHDVKFSPHPENLDEEVTKANEAARAEYAGLYEFLYNLPPNRFMSLGRRFLLAGAVPVEIVSINSSLLNQAEGAFQGHGFVGEEQLQEAARAMRWSDEKDGSPRAFRVVMLHHHIVPVTYREQPQHGRIYSVVLDAAAMTSWASRHDVDLILHGHMHQPAATRLDTPTTRTGRVDEWKRVTIVGMGSTGVAQADLGEIAQNTFGLMTFGPDEVRVAIHTIDPTRTRTRSEPAYVDLNVKYEWRK